MQTGPLAPFWTYDNAGTFVGSLQATLNSNSGKRKVSRG